MAVGGEPERSSKLKKRRERLKKKERERDDMWGPHVILLFSLKWANMWSPHVIHSPLM